MRVRHLVEGDEQRRAQLLQRTHDQVIDLRVLVASHFNRDTLMDSPIGRNIKIAARHLEHRGPQVRGLADDLFNTVILDIVEDEDALNRDGGAHSLGDGITPGDKLMTWGDLDGALRTRAGDRGLLGFARLTLNLALMSRMVGAVLGLGRRAFAFEATARVSARPDFRALLRAWLAHGSAAPVVSSHRVRPSSLRAPPGAPDPIQPSGARR